MIAGPYSQGGYPHVLPKILWVHDLGPRCGVLRRYGSHAQSIPKSLTLESYVGLDT